MAGYRSREKKTKQKKGEGARHRFPFSFPFPNLGKVPHRDAPLYGCGSKLNRRGYAGFGPCFHLPGFHFGTGFLSHRHMVFLFELELGKRILRLVDFRRKTSRACPVQVS